MGKGGRSGSGAEREARVAEVFAAWVAREGLVGCDGAVPGSVLVVDDDDGGIERAVKQAGAESIPWRRRAIGNRVARAWPDDGLLAEPADAAVIRLPRDWAGFEMHAHAVRARVRAGGSVFVLGGNDEGVKSAPRRLAEVLGIDEAAVETPFIKARTRVLRAPRPAGDEPRGGLDDWRSHRTVVLPGGRSVDQVVWPGLFAADGLDEGTALLLANLPELKARHRVLDLACGTGIVGQAVLAREPGVSLFGCDVDALAVHCTRCNLPEAQVLLGDGWGAIELGARFDLILSNPPLHVGHAQDLGPLDAMLAQAPLRLTRGGKLVVVTWRTAGAVKRLEAVFPKVRVRAEDGRYQVVEAWGTLS